MKIPIKINFENPILYALGFIFFFSIPYLYPSFHFKYTKIFSPGTHILICSFIVILVALSYYASKVNIFPNRSHSRLQVPQQFYKVCKIGLYIAFFMNVLIVLNALQAYQGNILSTKKSLEEFGGINIVSQVYMFFLPPFIYYAYNHKKRHKLALFFLGTILLIRSILMAERVAFLEFLVPVFVTYFIATEKKVFITKILKYFSLLLLFFMVLELSRQFYNQYLERGGSVEVGFALSWALERFFAYYADTTNKFYFALTHDLEFSSQHYLNPFERIISRISTIEIQSSTIDFGEHRWKDFTNPGGLTMLYTDFGYFAVLAFTLTFTIFFKSFRSIKEGSLFALCIYPNLVTVILELPRFVNFYNTRFFVPFILFLFVYTTYKYLILQFPKEHIKIKS